MVSIDEIKALFTKQQSDFIFNLNITPMFLINLKDFFWGFNLLGKIFSQNNIMLEIDRVWLEKPNLKKLQANNLHFKK